MDFEDAFESPPPAGGASGAGAGWNLPLTVTGMQLLGTVAALLLPLMALFLWWLSRVRVASLVHSPHSPRKGTRVQ